MKNTQGQRQF